MIHSYISAIFCITMIVHTQLFLQLISSITTTSKWEKWYNLLKLESNRILRNLSSTPR